MIPARYSVNQAVPSGATVMPVGAAETPPGREVVEYTVGAPPPGARAATLPPRSAVHTVPSGPTATPNGEVVPDATSVTVPEGKTCASFPLAVSATQRVP